MKTVLVLGGTGMLGSALVRVLVGDERLDVQATARAAELSNAAKAGPLGVLWSALDADETPHEPLPPAAWVVNAIGLIKHNIDERDPTHVERAIDVNALFPHRLARAREPGARVVQIATDCVYSGARGLSVEDAPHDALDVYGKTKSLGEVRADGFHNLRCSIVGPEEKGRRSLLEWFLGQPRGARVKGFTNHLWNGVTTLHFARLVRGAIVHDLPLARVQHVVPAAPVSKARLLELFADAFDRRDVQISPEPAGVAVDRTIATSAPEANRALWRAAGYDAPPTIEHMIQELAAWHAGGRA